MGPLEAQRVAREMLHARRERGELPPLAEPENDRLGVAVWASKEFLLATGGADVDTATRKRLRQIQDGWLAVPAVRNHVEQHGEDGRIAGPGSPTFREVREVLLADWESWFREETNQQ